jgi:aspartate/methionine/tyrosine aminotransferase
MPDKVISIFSFSKSYSMTGWRVGYALANQEILQKMIILSQISITNVAPFIQFAALTALSDEEVEIDVLSFAAEMSNRFNAFKNYIDDHKIAKNFLIPKAGFYFLINIEQYGSSVEVSNYFLDNFNIACTPGISFGDSMDKYLRFSIAAQDKISIVKALDSVRIFFNNNKPFC